MAARGLGGPGRRPRPLWGWTYVTVANTLWCLGVNWGVRGWDLFLGAKLVLGATGRGQRLADPSGRRPGPGAYFPLSCVCPARPPWCSAQDPVKERGGKAQNSTKVSPRKPGVFLAGTSGAEQQWRGLLGALNGGHVGMTTGLSSQRLGRATRSQYWQQGRCLSGGQWVPSVKPGYLSPLSPLQMGPGAPSHAAVLA